jgi:broad specificity phosphatase PhoE
MGTMAQEKRVFLVRHAESTNNVAKGTLSRTLGRLRPPSSRDEAWQLLSLLTFPMDSELSADGRIMLERQREACAALAAREAIEVVLHSPLRRAADTAAGLFPDLRRVEDADVYEKSLAEHAGLTSLDARVRSFRERLAQRPELCLAVVGHSAFFRCLVPEMAARRDDLRNVSVWRVTCAADGQCRELELEVPGWNGGVQSGPVGGAENAAAAGAARAAQPGVQVGNR